MKPGNQQGMSLIELLVSLVVLGIVIFPLINLYRHSGLLTAHAGHEVAALNYAREIIESIKCVDDSHTGVVQAIGDETITFEHRTSVDYDAYDDFYVAITGGGGSGQVRRVTGYDGGSRTATVDQPWDTPLPEVYESTYLLLAGFDQKYDFKISVVPGALNLKTVRAAVYYNVNDQLKDISLTTEKLMR
nr:prepilin-type N-terminal cleavage/methylation domain-containing protein [Pelotomaculum propionicicum]